MSYNTQWRLWRTWPVISFSKISEGRLFTRLWEGEVGCSSREPIPQQDRESFVYFPSRWNSRRWSGRHRRYPHENETPKTNEL
jgi:hypothetical protein